jgi:hypothetical protein
VRRPILLLSLLFAVSSFADIKLRVMVPTSSEGLRSVWRVIVTNDKPVPVKAVPVYVWTDGVIETTSEVCTPSVGSTTSADCTVDLDANSSRTIEFTARRYHGASLLQAGAQSGRVVDYDMTSAGPAFVVTTTADSGPGSLRQAIEDANRDCPLDGCVIGFALDEPLPEEGWFTIRPASPLPAIEGSFVVIDGGSQSRHRGETNPFGGPEIMLDGSLTGHGHGLFFSRGLGRVSDLAIGRFEGNGIESSAGGSFRRNYLGVDPSGRVAAPNHLRGLQINGGSARVVDNVLSGNLRAGGFFSSTMDILVYGNLVGAGTDGTPLGNGAGLFFHKPSVSGWVSYAFDNVISNNTGMGIALSLEANADVANNVFRNNAGSPVDVGLDGPTLDTTPGLPGQGGRMGAPVLLDAHWDGTGTVITGRIAGRPWNGLAGEQVYIHAGSTPEATDEVVALVSNNDRPFPDGVFNVRVDKDLRGSFIRASTFSVFVYDWDHSAAGTSELSEPRFVGTVADERKAVRDDAPGFTPPRH